MARNQLSTMKAASALWRRDRKSTAFAKAERQKFKSHREGGFCVGGRAGIRSLVRKDAERSGFLKNSGDMTGTQRMSVPSES